MRCLRIFSRFAANYFAISLLEVAFLVVLMHAPASAFEIPAIKTTSYAPPDNAIFVRVDGSDRNTGGLDSPLQTISAALRRASSGSTIVIGGGTYREALPVLSSKVTIQPFPGETVWIKGSIAVTGWVLEGNGWVRGNWRDRFCSNCFHEANMDPEFPMAGDPAQLFVDGKPLDQVGSRSDLDEGSFFIDRDRELLVIGVDPENRLVEAVVHENALTVRAGGEGTRIRGLGFAHFSPASQPGLDGMVKADATAMVFENNTFAFSAVKGLVIYKSDAIVRGNTFIHNGMAGFGAWKASGLTVEENRFAFNNRERFAKSGIVAEASGAKITETSRLTVRNNVFESNAGNGLWLDINVIEADVSGNTFRRNERHGLYAELSARLEIGSNTSEDNASAGIALANSVKVDVFDNRLARNRIGFLIQNDRRVNRDPGTIALGSSWISGEIHFFDNRLFVGESQQLTYLWARDFAGNLDAQQMLASSAGNRFYSARQSNPSHFAIWWEGTREQRFPDLEAFQALPGRERGSQQYTGSGNRSD